MTIRKKGDWIIGAGILIFACLSGLWLYSTQPEGDWVLVTVDGEEYARCSLNENQVLDIGGTNRLEIRDGEALMVYADCPDQICVHTAPVRRAHETIVCLPNRVIAEVMEE